MLFKKKKNHKKVGLALGSGGSRGLAHIGVIKVLEKEGIPIDFIAGSSMGSLVGGMYAASKNIKSVEEFALSVDKNQIFRILNDPSIIGGLINGNKIESFIREYLENLTFADLKIPFHAIATDLNSAEAVVLSRGDVCDAIRASMSVPLIMEPVKHGNHIFLDGGLSQPVPVETVKKMGASVVVAVNLDTPCVHKEKDINMKIVAEAMSNILRHHLAKSCLVGADVVLEPHFEDATLFGLDWGSYYSNAKGLIEKGEAAMHEALPKLKSLL